MSLTDIVGTTPEPWWPELVSNVNLRWSGRSTDGTEGTKEARLRLMFIGACIEWLLKQTPLMLAADPTGAIAKTLNKPRHDAPDLLSALVAACRSTHNA